MTTQIKDTQYIKDKECSPVLSGIVRPILELNENVRKHDIFTPKPVMSPCTEMGRTFGSFDAYKTDMSPRGSKAEFSHFLDKLTRETNYFDSNVGNNIAIQKKILAHKSKE